jgi:hypothetical protein
MLPKSVVTASFAVFAAGLLTIVQPARSQDDKLKPEQLIAKHLESIAPAAKLKELKTLTAVGDAHVEYRVGGKANLEGQGNLLSDGISSRLALKFSDKDYPGEGIVSDGSKILVTQISTGKRSNLGQFLVENDFLLKEGLLYGSLTSAWALLHVSAKQPKLDVTGIKNINGRQLYEMKYVPKKGGSGLLALLYFDPQTFRHVRSQFSSEQVTPEFANINTNGTSSRYVLTEDFDDFSDVDGLTLPHSYKIDLVIEARNKDFAGSWKFTVKQAVRNQTLNPQLFSVN